MDATDMDATETRPTEAHIGSAASSERIIEMTRVNKWFGAFHVLKDIDLTVRKGERIVVCGPSGSGKSTLIRCINHLEAHQEGQIVVDGTELNADVRNIDAIRAEVGMVFQQFNLFPHLTVLENCTLAPMWVKQMPKAEAEELAMTYLERVQIPEQADKYPAQLSGGQQQRVAIARSLCMRPKIMLFDEPTSALDPEIEQKVAQALERLMKGRTVIVIAHRFTTVRHADVIHVIDQGMLVESGSHEELMAEDGLYARLHRIQFDVA